MGQSLLYISHSLQVRVPLQVSSTSSYRMVSQVPRGRWLGPLSPLQMLKAVKNETEAKGMRAAHVSSSSQIVSLFHWCCHGRSVMVLLSVSTCVGWRGGWQKGL